LLYALLELDRVVEDPARVVANKKILLGKRKVTMPLDNW
jgi:hypothetical protein